MKKILIGALLIAVQYPAIAQDKWIINRDGEEVKMRPQYDYDYSKQYKGNIDEDGSVRLRNQQTGEVLRGQIDSDGNGYLRDANGNRVRVRPR